MSEGTRVKRSPLDRLDGDHDDRIYERMQRQQPQELSPLTPEQLEQRRQLLGLRPITPFVPKPPRRRKSSGKRTSTTAS